MNTQKLEQGIEEVVNQATEALKKVVTLRITTIVTSKTTLKEDGDVEIADNSRVMQSQINLVDGDIETTIHEDFLESPLEDVREFHQEREKQGQEIIQRNIKAIGELLNLASTLRSFGSSSEASNTLASSVTSPTEPAPSIASPG